MSQFEKLLERVTNNPKTVRFEELDKILKKDGFECSQAGKGSSHYVYYKGELTTTIPRLKPYVKRIYVERALALLSYNVEE